MASIDRRAYAEIFGPTVGDRVRLIQMLIGLIKILNIERHVPQNVVES